MKPEAPRREPSPPPAPDEPQPHPATASLWEQCFSRENLAAALRRVERNGGAPGIDGTRTQALRPWLKRHWPEVKAALDAGTYQPSPVRRVTIPKPTGGERELGVPTALDRMIQQALSQVLTPVFDPHFSERSCGFLRSERAGQRVMDGTCSFIERRLKLRVNQGKSSVGSAFRATLLGFGFLRREGEVKVRIDPQARTRAKDRLRRLTSRRWGVSMERRIREVNRFTVGWTAYFALADTPRPLSDLDEWLRRRLRQVRWKEWKRYRTRRRNLRALGIPERSAREWAGSRKGYWRLARSWVLSRSLPDAYWRDLGLQGFSDPYRRFRDAKRTAGCGPACPVVWEGRA